MAVKKKTQGTGRDANRVSFAKVTDALTVPDLLALQTESFAWLIGTDGSDAKSGLEEIFEEFADRERPHAVVVHEPVSRGKEARARRV